MKSYFFSDLKAVFCWNFVLMLYDTAGFLIFLKPGLPGPFQDKIKIT